MGEGPGLMLVQGYGSLNAYCTSFRSSFSKLFRKRKGNVLGAVQSVPIGSPYLFSNRLVLEGSESLKPTPRGSCGLVTGRTKCI